MRKRIRLVLILAVVSIASNCALNPDPQIDRALKAKETVIALNTITNVSIELNKQNILSEPDTHIVLDSVESSLKVIKASTPSNFAWANVVSEALKELAKRINNPAISPYIQIAATLVKALL